MFRVSTVPGNVLAQLGGGSGQGCAKSRRHTYGEPQERSDWTVGGVLDTPRSKNGVRTLADGRSLLGTCKLNGFNPQTYLTVTLRRIVDMHPMSQVDDLMPWNFAE